MLQFSFKYSAIEDIALEKNIHVFICSNSLAAGFEMSQQNLKRKEKPHKIARTYL